MTRFRHSEEISDKIQRLRVCDQDGSSNSRKSTEIWLCEGWALTGLTAQDSQMSTTRRQLRYDLGAGEHQFEIFMGLIMIIKDDDDDIDNDLFPRWITKDRAKIFLKIIMLYIVICTLRYFYMLIARKCINIFNEYESCILLLYFNFRHKETRVEYLIKNDLAICVRSGKGSCRVLCQFYEWVD